jgi:hypothetical protein
VHNWPEERQVGAGESVPTAHMCQNTAEHGSVGCAAGIAMSPGSDVTNCTNENPSITSLFPIAYLE